MCLILCRNANVKLKEVENRMFWLDLINFSLPYTVKPNLKQWHHFIGLTSGFCGKT